MGNRYCGACRGERGCRDCTAAVRAAKYAGLTEFSAEGLFQGDVPQEAAAPGGTASEHSFGMPEALLLAADIGTTTLGFVCADEQGRVLASYGVENPQRQTAADVIGRIDAACRGAGTQLKKQIREALAEGFLFVLKRAESLFAEPGAAWERLPVRIALAGNTTMQHLLLGYPLDGMAKAPFCPYSVGEVHVSFASLFSETAAYAGLPDTRGCSGRRLCAFLSRGCRGSGKGERELSVSRLRDQRRTSFVGFRQRICDCSGDGKRI